MRRNTWLHYNRSGEIIEIIVRDSTGRKVDSFKVGISEKAKINSIMKILKDKYNFSPEIKQKNWL